MMKKYSFYAVVFSLGLAGILAFSSPGQILKTQLRLVILNELGNTVEGANVTLYNNDEDYRQEKNPVMETQVTDSKGRVKFSGLEPKVYYVHAEKGDRDNAGAGVQTDTLQEGRINKVNIIIE